MSRRIANKDSDHPQPFATTQWSIVVRAGKGECSESRRALSSLCEAYWYPLYVYVRRKGYQQAEAQDLTQAFFVELLEKDRIRLADQQRGRFRSFLLSSLDHFVANQWRDAHAKKRGGTTPQLSLDFAAAENRYVREPSHEMTPERVFERRWAMTLLDNAVHRLRKEYESNGKTALFDHLKDHLGGDPQALPYAELGDALQMSEGAVKVAAHRLRKRWRDLLRTEIAETVAESGEVDDELRSLFSALEP
ncbi:MAG: RNA polymerase sigma factor [Pirellulaceae bacterium]